MTSQRDEVEEGTQEQAQGPSLNRTQHALPVMRGRRLEREQEVTNPARLMRPPRRASSDEDTGSAPYREPRALRVERAGVEDLVVPLYPDRTYVFGRAPESTVVFPHDAVSRQHGQLSFRDDQRWVYRDLNSTNGSFLGREGVDPGEEDDLRRLFLKMQASRDWVLEAGTCLLLGNGKSRVSLLAEVPEGLAADTRERGQGSAATERLERAIGVCAHHQLPVFLLGPSGTGKTFVAREIHRRSHSQGTFVILNCGRLPQDSTELTSELLGHVRGAFTGAVAERVGKLYVADGGTLFLDEVEFLPPAAQDFLIDVLEGSGSFAPLGAPRDSRPAPRFRLISASKRPLNETPLRRDLAQRLTAGDLVRLPTLEERGEDIPLLVATFLQRLKVEQQYDAEITPEALSFLRKARWPGEIRELESTVKAVVAREAALRSLEGLGARRIVVSLEAVKGYLQERQVSFGTPPQAPMLGEEQLPPTLVPRKRPSDLTVQDIREALARCQGNKTRAAISLSIAVNTLKDRMRKLGMEE